MIKFTCPAQKYDSFMVRVGSPRRGQIFHSRGQSEAAPESRNSSASGQKTFESFESIKIAVSPPQIYYGNDMLWGIENLTNCLLSVCSV